MADKDCGTITPSRRVIRELMARDSAVHYKNFAARFVGELAEFREGACFVPDGYKFDHAAKVLTVIEVDDTNPIDARKAEKIGWLADDLLGADWDTRVLVLDYMGAVKADVPGWTYLPVYIEDTPGNALDRTPAAAAIARRCRGESGTGTVGL